MRAVFDELKRWAKIWPKNEKKVAKLCILLFI